MEEDAPGVAVAEGLDLGALGAGEALRALGQVEDFAVPVQDRRARSESAEDRVFGVEDLDRRAADLRPLPQPHLGTERSRQQLRAEADAEHRHIAAHRLGQPLALASASSGWRSTSSTFIGPPITTAPATSSWSGSGWPASGLTVCTSSRTAGIEDPVRGLPRHVLDRQQGGTVVRLIAPQASRATVWAMPQRFGISFFRPEVRSIAATGMQARGAVAVGALAVGAAAIGGFAIGRLSVGRLAVGKAAVGKLAVEELEIGRLQIRERTGTDDGA